MCPPLIAHLGRADQFAPSEVDSVINGLLKATGRPDLEEILTRGVRSETTEFTPSVALARCGR
jgi:hypothetical protein